MAKKSKKTSLLEYVLLVLSVLVGVGGIFFLFGDGLFIRITATLLGQTTEISTEAVTGFDFLFSGVEDGDPYVGLQVAFYLAVGGIALALIGLVLKFLKVGKPGSFLAIIGGIVAVVGGAMLFFSKTIAGLEDVVIEGGALGTMTTSYVLGWGLLISATCICVSGILAALGGMAGTLKK